MNDKDSFNDTHNNNSLSQTIEMDNEEMDRQFMEKMYSNKVRTPSEKRQTY